MNSALLLLTVGLILVFAPLVPAEEKQASAGNAWKGKWLERG